MNFVARGKDCIDYWSAFFPDSELVIAPFQVTLRVTNKCNLRCRHCSVSAGAGGKNELSTPDFFGLIDDLDSNKVAALLFTGGEPLVRKDIFEIIRHASEKGFFTGISTNATLITAAVAKSLKKSGVQIVQVSIDGPEKVHDKIRGVKAYKRTLRGVKNCVKAGLKLNINMVATKLNSHCCLDVIKIAEKAGAYSISITDCVPVGRAGENSGLVLPDSEFREVCSLIGKQKGKRKIKIISENILKYAENRKYGKKILSRCGAGVWRCNIDASGIVSPCVLWPIDCGKYKGNFRELWLNSTVFKKLRERENLRGICGECELKFSCGGCRARAFACTGDIFAGDDRCLMAKKSDNAAMEKK